MRELIQASIKDCQSLSEIQRVLCDVLARQADQQPIAYVSGKITADGPDYIYSNLARLDEYTSRVTQEFDGLVFSAADIFNAQVYQVINQVAEVSEAEFYTFWQNVLLHGVTHIFMTPGWEESRGATDEHQTAQKLGLKIIYLSTAKFD